MAYTLNLKGDDLDTIGFVGNRYYWSESICNLVEGDNHISESDAWVIKNAIDLDMDGGHDAFPMLDNRSDLCDKLYKLYNEIV
tara:strand:- start:1576 stop:1824 length:249 start_codon:yes stop_codon:yes gene_type:complete